MKQLHLSLLSCISLAFLFSCSTSYKSIQPRNPHKSFVSLTEGSNIYYSKTETSNLEYRRFLEDIKEKDELKWSKCIVDSVQWDEKYEYSYNQPFVRNYHWHPYFNDHPVVNISHYAAEQYCKWLNEKYRAKNKRQEVIFRLPTVTELETLCNSADIKYDSDDPSDYPKDDTDKMPEYTKFKFNLMFPNNYPIDGGQYTVKVSKHKQNELGLFSIIGNAAELADDGKAYNGSWGSLPSVVKQVAPYKATDPRIGFRVVMEVTK